MITARENGRHLEIIVGGGADALTYLIPPVTAKIGAELLADWIGLASGSLGADEALQHASRLAARALSPEVIEQIDDLRWAEQEQVTNAAFMWNVQGGGIDLVNLYLVDGLGKARDALLARTGVLQALDTYRRSLNLESASPTNTDDSPATSTPVGTDSGPV